MQPPADIARLWKRGDGIECILTRRHASLMLCLKRDDEIVKAQEVESPQEALALANAWRSITNR